MKKITMLFVLTLACVGVQAQTLMSRTTWIEGNSDISYTVYEPAKDTVYFCSFREGTPVSRKVTLKFNGRNDLIQTLLFMFNIRDDEGYRYRLDKTIGKNTILVGDESKSLLFGWEKYITVRSSDDEMREDVSVTIEEIGNRYLKPLGVIVDTKLAKRKNKRDERLADKNLDDAYKY